MGDTTLTGNPFAGVPVVATEQPWFQAWVPFQSGYLGGGAQPGTSYVVGAYGLLDPARPQPMGSFLHLGAADPDLLTPTPVAENDPQKQATFLRAYNLATQVTDFIDDHRVRGPTATPPAERVKETQLLMKKGGWRDHTDGNRITTTAGDKVEVIGGNSVLVILGRPTADNAFNAVDWSETGTIANHEIESSGTFNYDNDGAPGHVEEIRWVENPYPGTASTWMVRSKTYQADEIDISSGELRESFVGTTVELASGDAYRYRGRLSDIPGTLSGNPAFNLKRIMRDEQLDAATFPYIDDNADEDFITSVTQNANASFGAGLASSLSQNITEYAVLDSLYTDTTVNGLVTDNLTVTGSVVETHTINGPVTETTTMTNHTATTTVSEAMTEVTTVGLNLASVTTVGLGVEDVTAIGLNHVEVEIVALAKEDIGICTAEVDVTVSAVESLEATITGLAQEVAIYVDKIEVDAGIAKQVITLTPTVKEFGSVKEALTALTTLAAETWMRISSPLVSIEGVVMLGDPPEAEEEMEAEEVAADEAAAAPEEEAVAAPAEAAA